jgi:hypothetical protein
MPDVISLALADVRMFVSLDLHTALDRRGDAAASGRPADGGADRVHREGGPPSGGFWLRLGFI